MESRRVLILTASMGSGHLEVAAELTRQLNALGHQARTIDILEAAGPAGARLRRTYRILLDHAPAIYDAAMRVWAARPQVMQRLTSLGSGPFLRALTAATDDWHPHTIVSTYNLASQCLGRLAATGRVTAKTATLVIDPGPHPYWVHPAVDLHLAPTPECARALRSFGAADVETVAVPLRPEYDPPPSRADARERLGWPNDAHIAIVSAGSWAVGRVPETLDAMPTAEVTPVVLCGRNTALLEAVRARGACAVGWTDEVAYYLAAADVVVDNAGGLTCWEAVACGTPVVCYLPIPGHGRLNVDALATSGRAHFARDAAELSALVRSAVGTPSAARAQPPSGAATVLAERLLR